VAVAIDAGHGVVAGGDRVWRLLGPVPVGDVRERLPEAERLLALLAALDGRVVRLERRRLAGRPRGRGDEGGNLADLCSRKAPLERGHAVAADAHLMGDRGRVRLERVEAGPDLALP